MNAGQTFAIAGLLQNRVESTKKATPFFGELPYVGTLFRRVAEQNNEIELLITVTPELAEAMDPHQVPPGGPGLNTDVPNDKEFYLRGYMEVPRTDCGVPEGGMIEGQCLPFDGAAVHGTHQEMGAGPSAASPAVSYPTGQIVPTSRPTPIGPGVTLVSPQQ
jgi:pilus assembly protein CpaC